MDELSTQELRGSAFAANLRRAFEAPDGDALPRPFLVLLDRLKDLEAAPPPPELRLARRLGV